MVTSVNNSYPNITTTYDVNTTYDHAVNLYSSPASAPSSMLSHVIVTIFITAIVAPFSYYMGLGARYFKLPQITGYLASGIICGPYFLGVLSKESVLDLNIIESTCLAVIGLAAGAELDLPQLSRSKKQVLGITLFICLLSWVICYVTFDFMLPVFPVIPGIDSRHLLAASSLGATLMMARSPASAIAVMKEMDGKGPFCTLVIAVVVVKDVLVIVAFALNIELIRAVILPAKSGISIINLLLPVINVFVALGLGACGGLLLGFIMHQRPSISLTIPFGQTIYIPNLGTEHPRARVVLLLVLSTALFHLAHRLDAEPLLACVTAGMVAVNRRHERVEKEKEELHHVLQQIMSLSNVAFFGLAGASLKLSALKGMFGLALIVCVVRLGAIYMGCWLGCVVTSTSVEFRRSFWLSMVTQAGVAMGLARLAGTRFPDWGPHFQTFMMSIILINLLIGPPLFSFALLRVGEDAQQVALLQDTTSHSISEREPHHHSGSNGTAVPVEAP